MNGNSTGIVPTIDLATNNGAYPYPVMYGNGGFGNGMFGGDGAIWIILIIALLGGFGNNNGGFYGNNSFDNGYAWLSNGQKDIMNQTSDGFNSLHLSNQIEGVRDGIASLSNQLCNCCADMNQTVSNGFYNTEISANNRQMANMNQIYGLSTQLASASADNRLGIANLNSTILAENCADRQALSEGVRDIMANDTNNTRAILDKLCQLELDGVKAQVEAKNDKIAELQTQLNMANLSASQVSQTAQLRLSEEQQFENFYNRLKNCPVNAVAVYGNTPVFTCPGSGCGCGYNTTSQFI